MIRHLKVFLIFLILNTMVASIYLVWGVIRSSEKGQWKNYLFKAEVMLFCPGVGPMFFFVSNLIYKIFFRKAVDLADVIFSKERVTTFKRADIEAEGNLVPIEEALVVSDKGSQRALLLKVARGDIHNSLASISLALNSDDSETAHYAAAVLQDALNDFRLRVQELYGHMKEDEEDVPEYAALMIEYMNNMLSQNVFDELEQKKYIDMMEEAGEVLYSRAKEKLTAVYIECICLRLLQAMEYDRMEVWCGRSKELHPDMLSTYTLQLKLYFTIQEKQKFFLVLNALKQSDIVIDRDTLALIRAFYETDSEKRTAKENGSEHKAEEKETPPENKDEQKKSVESNAASVREEQKVIENEAATESENTNDKAVEKAENTDDRTVEGAESESENRIVEDIESKPENRAVENTFGAAAAVLAAAAAVGMQNKPQPESKEATAGDIQSKPQPEFKEATTGYIQSKPQPEFKEATTGDIQSKPQPEFKEATTGDIQNKPQIEPKETKEAKEEQARILRSIFEEIEQEEAAKETIFTEETISLEETISPVKQLSSSEQISSVEQISSIEEISLEKENSSIKEISPAKELLSAEASALQKKSEETALTKTMVSSVIEDLIAENAAAEDINKQINHIIEELITESEAREKESAAARQTESEHIRQISDQKKIEVLKTIARKHKIWALLGLGIVIAGACLLIYIKNKKSKEEQ